MTYVHKHSYTNKSIVMKWAQIIRFLNCTFDLYTFRYPIGHLRLTA